MLVQKFIVAESQGIPSLNPVNYAMSGSAVPGFRSWKSAAAEQIRVKVRDALYCRPWKEEAAWSSLSHQPLFYLCLHFRLQPSRLLQLYPQSFPLALPASIYSASLLSCAFFCLLPPTTPPYLAISLISTSNQPISAVLSQGSAYSDRLMGWDQ